MIVNNKFRPPVESLEQPPIKKNFDFYKTTGNLWDSQYLSSPKVAKYYHNAQQTFMTGPNSPYAISVQESTDKSRAYAEKAFIHKKEAQELLQRRKVERLQIQNPGSVSLEGSATFKKKYYDKPVAPANAWERLNSLPACKLRHVIPPSVVEKDSQGIRSILMKSQEIEKLQDWKEGEKQSNRLRARLATINRHNQLKQLEIKCGILKVRDKSCVEGIFGYIRANKTRQRTEELCKPRTANKGGQFDHQDFRGMLHADFLEAVGRAAQTGECKGAKTKPEEIKEGTSGVKHEAKESEKDIKDFENKRIQGSDISSIEVMSYDLVKEVFK